MAERLPRRGPDPRAAGRHQAAQRPACERRPVRRAFPPRGDHAAALSHPNIVSIYDRGEAEGTYYIAMEHLEGRNLKELLRARGPAPVQYAIEYVPPVLAALRYAHRNGTVHRDIKPHNVLIDSDGRVKVTDFGIARAAARQMTEVGSIVGTAQYLSPEQARGAAVDQRSDLYSLGVVLYELLTGRCPSPATAGRDRHEAPLDTPPPPSEVREGPERPRRDARAGQGPGGALPVRRGDGARPRAHRGRLVREPETEEAATPIMRGQRADPDARWPRRRVTQPYRPPARGRRLRLRGGPAAPAVLAVAGRPAADRRAIGRLLA